MYTALFTAVRRYMLPQATSLVNTHNKACDILCVLLATLRAAHLIHWTGHWQVKGDTQYGDHLLLERVYTALADEIDTLAEKVVSTFGCEAVDPISQIDMISETSKVLADPCVDPLVRSLEVEEKLQKLLSSTFSELECMDYLTLGMNDFIMGMANSHDTFIYLLRQRLR
jgi:DNA-binding ferritin-like protein